MTDAGLTVLVSFISPYRPERDLARSPFAPASSSKIFVDTPLEVCEQRDVSALRPRLQPASSPPHRHDAPYEAPLNPELQLRTAALAPEILADEAVIITHPGWA